ncbi:MAG: SIR2 family protein [Chloroflexota bacterium]
MDLADPQTGNAPAATVPADSPSKPPAIKYLWSSHGEDWAALDDGASDGDVASSNTLSTPLARALAGDNLVLLAGLGTSLCIVDGGERLAPTMWDLWSRAKDRCGTSWSDTLQTVGYAAPDAEGNIEDLLTRCQLHQALHPSDAISDFIAGTEMEIASACRFVGDTTELPFHEALLRRIARRGSRLSRAKVFTTNYDLAFETAASRSRFVVIDGFSHTYPQQFDGLFFNYDVVIRGQGAAMTDYVPNVFHLYKLHGSVDWRRQGQEVVRDAAVSNPHIIYPRQGKYEASYSQPFIEMMTRFQTSIREPNCTIVVCGFGFGDAHITQPLLAAIRSNVGMHLIVVDPSLEAAARPTQQTLVALAKQGDSRIILISGTFEQFVSLLPDVVPASDEEVHRERIAKALPA